MKQNRMIVGIIGAMVCCLMGCAQSMKSEVPQIPSTVELKTDRIDMESETENAVDSSLAKSEGAGCIEIQGEVIYSQADNMWFDGERVYGHLSMLEEVFLADGKFFPTSYIDKNGLHCVGHKYTPEGGDGYILEKRYVLSDNTVVVFDDFYEEVGVFDATGTMVYIEKLLDDLHWKYSVDYEQKRIAVHDVFYEKVLYEILTPQMQSNGVWLTNGTNIAADVMYGAEYRNKYTCTKKENAIAVEAGEKLILNFYFSWLQDVAGILFLDDKGQVVASQSSAKAFSVTDQAMVVPKNATAMHLTFFANQNYEIKREKTIWLPENSEIDNGHMMQSNMQMTALETPSNLSVQLDKAYVTFVLDDCRPDMDKVANIFLEYEMPLCIAGVWEIMNCPASEGDLTRTEVCQLVVENGGEVLAHDGEVLDVKRLADRNELEKQFVIDRYVLEQYGFEVNGIILAGGEGMVAGGEMTDLWSRNFFDYSDLYGAESKGEPYYHRRLWLGQAKDKYKELISEAIEKNKWVIFYFHDLKEVDAKTLREILTYIASKEEQLEVITYHNMYTTVYGLEKR